MKRKIYDSLLAWKAKSAGRKALMIDGARRVGKSYIAEEFARNEYKSYILIDFNRTSSAVRRLFDDYLDDLDMLFTFLSAMFNTKLYERESLIILDEVQFYPRARSAIKYLVADGRYDYLETGSLISIHENVKDIMIPSEEQRIEMFPMDFEEFLWAIGNDTLMPLIMHCCEERKPLGQAMHRKAMDYFRQYIVVGGMPQAVQAFCRTRSFSDADAEKRDILKLYREDIAKHAEARDMPMIRAVFDKLPSLLSRHEKKFSPSLVVEGKRGSDFDKAIFWLDDAMIINVCYSSTEPNIGLGMNLDDSKRKCYMGDTGLLVSLAFSEKSIADEEIYRKIITGKLEFNKGMIIENIVAQMLRSTGHKLYFFSSYDKGSSADTMEIDFLIAKKTVTSRRNISPIEVKSGKNYTLSSMNKFRSKFREYAGQPYVIHTLDYSEKDGIIYLPLYMAYFL